MICVRGDSMTDGKISISAILGILIYHLAFVNLYAQFIPWYRDFRLILTVIIGALLFRYMKIFIRAEYHNFNFILLLFFAVIMFSTFHGRRFNNGYWPDTLLYAVTILELFLCFEYFNYRNSVNQIMNIFYRLTFAYCILTDLIMFFYPVYITREWGEKYYYYFIGDKFDVVYFHMLLIALFYIQCNFEKLKNRIMLVFLFVLLGFVSIYTECTTGGFGGIVLAITFILKDWFDNISRKPWATIIYMLFCGSFLILNSAVLSIPIVQNFVENVLHESITLTGRTNIYSKVWFISKSPWWGFGFDNNNPLTQHYIGVGDVQNGMLDCIVSYGVIGTVLMLILVVLVIRKGALKSSNALMALIYAFITLSMVEITFRRLFFAVLAMVAFAWNSLYDTDKYDKMEDNLMNFDYL